MWSEPSALTCPLPRLAAAPRCWGRAGCRRRELEWLRRDGGVQDPVQPRPLQGWRRAWRRRRCRHQAELPPPRGATAAVGSLGPRCCKSAVSPLSPSLWEHLLLHQGQDGQFQHREIPWVRSPSRTMPRLGWLSFGAGDALLAPCCGSAQRGLSLSPVSSPAGLHPLREVLHLQCGAGREASADHHEGGHWQWPGDHAGHPAGRVPASVGGNR